MTDPFADMLRALHNEDDAGPGDATSDVRVDPERGARTGIPEVVLGGYKSDEDLVASIARLVRSQGRVLVSRLRDQQWSLLTRFETGGLVVTRHAPAGIALVTRHDSRVVPTGGTIAVFSAGTSDRAVADEAALMAEEMGVSVNRATDAGVAGLHRLVRPLRDIMERGVDCIVVAAGMDGALPSVVAGLVDVPVIGLPVSVGYGHGGNGEAALMTMLQSCAPGMTVVNIDNGIGAGSAAARIANRMAATRQVAERSASSN